MDTPKPSGSLSPPQKKTRTGKRHPPLRQRSATVPSSPLSTSTSGKQKNKPPNLPPVSSHRDSTRSQTAPSSPGPLQHSGGSGGATPVTGRVLRQRSLEERRTTDRRGGRKTVAELASSAGAGGAAAGGASEEDAKALRLLSEVVSKLQGLVVASKSPQSARAKQPVAPPRAKAKAKAGPHTQTHTVLTHSPRQGKEHKEQKEHRELKDQKEHKELKDHKEHKELKDHKEHKQLKDHKEHKELKDHKEHIELKDHKELKELKELKDHKELKEHKEQKEPKEQKERKDQKEQKEIKELKELKEPAKSKKGVTESPVSTRFRFSISSSSSSSSLSSLSYSSRSPSLARRSSMKKLTPVMSTSPQRKAYLESLTPFNGVPSSDTLPLPISRSIDDYETVGCLFTRKKKKIKKKK